jgi:Uma2 family endonuclease
MAVRHAFTVDEWHRMGDAGLFGEGARVELLDGEVMEMSPIGSRHAGTVNGLTRLLFTAAQERAVVAVQNPVALDERSEPLPDVALLAPRDDDYRHAHPSPEEILLLVEVSDSSLDYDRDWKAPFYARAGVRECWVVDLESETVIVMRSPSLEGYLDQDVLGRGDVLDLIAIDAVRIEVDQVFGGT